ncbi:MAG: 6-carboxytetrahydropterin synthase QueD [Bacteroidetes bacterium GWA2_31_9]|nr:MAG: 6-carboxytetrahydropterin synthase QueD [Bacteroidetes bacterium GWA2_31_9]
MSIIRVTKEFNFEMAHALWNYDGKCRNVHGHSYKLFVTVIGNPINDENNPKHGMVIDFGDLKQIVNTEIISKYDHCLVLSEKSPFEKLKIVDQMFDRIEITSYQPTCENMIEDFANKIQKKLPSNVKLLSLRLYETETSFGEWFADDQK